MTEESTETTGNDTGTSVSGTVQGVFKTYGMSTMLLWIGAGLMIIGSFMSWAKLGGISIGGMDADGGWTLAMGLIIAAVGALPFLKQIKLKLTGDISYWIVMAAALVAVYKLGDGAGSVRDAGDVSGLYSGLLGTGYDYGTSVGLGIWIAMIGGLIAVLAAGMLKHKISVKSVGDVKGLNKNKQMLLFVPAAIYLAIFFIFYL